MTKRQLKIKIIGALSFVPAICMAVSLISSLFYLAPLLKEIEKTYSGENQEYEEADYEADYEMYSAAIAVTYATRIAGVVTGLITLIYFLVWHFRHIRAGDEIIGWALVLISLSIIVFPIYWRKFMRY